MMKNKATPTKTVSKLEKLHIAAKSTESAWSAAAQQANALRPAYNAAFNAFEKAETAARRRVKRLGKLADPTERAYIRKVLDVEWTKQQDALYKARQAYNETGSIACEARFGGTGR